MNPVVLLRIAAVLTFLFFVGHTMGMPWAPALGPEEIAVVDAMKSHQFEAMGVTRSYWSFYEGFGVNLSAMLLLQAVLLWQLATLARTSVAGVRPLIAVFVIGFVVNAVLTWKYIFPIPALMGIAIAVCLVLALVSARRKTLSG